MTRQADKKQLYRLSRFTPDRLVQLHQELAAYAETIGGLPQNHTEVFSKRGWLIPFLFSFDGLLWGRWDYWTDILQRGTIADSGPIPKIEWIDFYAPNAVATKSMFENCLQPHDATIENFADWLLWGLAATKEAPRISDQLNEHYYRIFDLFLVLDNPTDYLSYLLCGQTSKGYKSGLGYYPTPFNIARMMVEITHGGGDPEKLKRQTVCDPCIGCGAMLLPASNYFLRGYGQDISSIAVKLCTIQMFFYAPWYACPGKVLGFDEEQPIKLVMDSVDNIAREGQMAFAF